MKKSTRRTTRQSAAKARPPVKQEKSRTLPAAAKPYMFKPGQSGNPKGRRPLGLTLADHVRQIGSELVDDEWTRLDLVVRSLYAEASAGKPQAAQIVLDRGWGKVPLAVDVMNWREQAERDGLDPNVISERLVAEFIAVMGGERAGRSLPESENRESAVGDGAADGDGDHPADPARAAN